jgi:peptidoglycan/LPS O-acetylase OafA/YrhL
MFSGRMISATRVRASAERPAQVKAVGAQQRSSEPFWELGGRVRQRSVKSRSPDFWNLQGVHCAAQLCCLGRRRSGDERVIMTELKSEAQPVERAVSDPRRLDVQGLRAVAVLLVVAAHAGKLPGGHFGVDIFFVISGFVITGMIQREWSLTGRFRFGHFYLRRFKRLIPALALMIAVTMVWSFFLLPPFQQKLTARMGLNAMLLTANFADALGRPGWENPVSHTWTLSVEEQYYLMFPAILLLGYALSPRGRPTPWAKVLVGSAAAISFGLYIVWSRGLHPLPLFAQRPSVLPLAWEFAVGALLASATTSRGLRSHKNAQIAAWLGAALLAAAVWLGRDFKPYFHGFDVLLIPVSGTLLLITAGTHHTTWLSRALAHPAMVKIGNWSYSIYLWDLPMHWFAIYATTNSIFPQVPWRVAAELAPIVSIPLGAASYRWVEQPLRQLRPLTRPRTLALIAATVVPPIVLAVMLNFAADHRPTSQTPLIVSLVGG